MPLAQSAAMWHTFSHVVAHTGGRDDIQLPRATHCDLCLAVAAVSGGGLLSAPLRLPLAAVRHEPPPTATLGVWLSPPALAYLSRAPPIARR